MTSLLWKELHERAATFVGTEDNAFIRTWGAKIPRSSSGCSCNEFWIQWRNKNPPTFATKELYFDWTVRLHNAVNVIL